MTRLQAGNHNAKKLTGEQVMDMRSRYASGAWTQGQLSRHFGVCLSTVRNILNGVTWQGTIVAQGSAVKVPIPSEAQLHQRINARLKVDRHPREGAGPPGGSAEPLSALQQAIKAITQGGGG